MCAGGHKGFFWFKIKNPFKGSIAHVVVHLRSMTCNKAVILNTKGSQNSLRKVRLQTWREVGLTACNSDLYKMSFFPSSVSSIFLRMKNPPSLRIRVLEKQTQIVNQVLLTKKLIKSIHGACIVVFSLPDIRNEKEGSVESFT